MNKAYKYTLTANEHKEITFDVGVNRLAISNANGTDGDTTIVTSEITKTDSGEICSFVDGADAPFAELTVNITAQQSGTGDPSPENVRPISGWTGANIYVSGEDTSESTTYNIDWEGEAGTVYFGMLNVKTGVLTVGGTKLDLGTINWTKSARGGGRIYASIQNMLVGELNTNYYDVLCDSYRGDNWETNSNVIMRYNNLIRIRDTRFENLTTAEIKTALSGVFAIYPLATSITYQLNPTEVRSLLGANNVWADCGNISLKYFVQSTQPLIDYINDEDDKCIYIDCEQTGLDTYSITSSITKAEFVSLLNKNKNVKLRLDTGSGDVIFDLSYVTANIADFTYNRTAVISDVNSFQSLTLRVDMSGDTLSLSRGGIITIGDDEYELVAAHNNQVVDSTWNYSTQGYSLSDAEELLFMLTPGVNVAKDNDTIIGELQWSSNDAKRAVYSKGIKNILPVSQEVESPFFFDDIVLIGHTVNQPTANSVSMRIRIWTYYYNLSDPSLADVAFWADCDCTGGANLWPMCNLYIYKKKKR